MNRPCYYQAFIIGSFLLPAPNGRCPHCSLEHHRPFHKMCLLCNFSPSSPIDRPSTIQLNLFSVAAFGALHPDKNEMTPEKRLEDLSLSLWIHTPVWCRTIQCFGLYYYDDALFDTNWTRKQRIHENALACFSTST